MTLSSKNILLISPEPWEHIFVSKHHYAEHLASRGNKVFFLNPPGKGVHLARTRNENVWSVSYDGFPKGLRFYPRFLQNSITRKKFNLIQKVCGVKFDIIWSFDNSVFYKFSALSGSLLKISHIVDLNQDFQTKAAAKTSDYNFCTTDLILKRIQKYSDSAYKINHGYNLVNNDVQMDAVIQGENKIKALLMGNLAMQYLDWEVLLKCVQENRTVDFIFYGPNSDQFSEDINNHHRFKRQLVNLSNAYFSGVVESDEIPSILNHVDILIVSYQEAFHNEQANPHKMMEYLGSGKVIVATKTIEYLELANRDLIAMSSKNAEFCNTFNEVVNNLDHWNRNELRDERMAFALNNSYEKQIDLIEKIILNNETHAS